MENERRSGRRAAASFPAAFRRGQEWLRGRVRDISRTGCFVETDATAGPAGSGTLSLRTPMGMWVEIPGYAARLSPGEGFGFKFEHLTDIDAVVVEYLIDYLEDGAGV